MNRCSVLLGSLIFGLQWLPPSLSLSSCSTLLLLRYLCREILDALFFPFVFSLVADNLMGADSQSLPGSLPLPPSPGAHACLPACLALPCFACMAPSPLATPTNRRRGVGLRKKGHSLMCTRSTVDLGEKTLHRCSFHFKLMKLACPSL